MDESRLSEYIDVVRTFRDMLGTVQDLLDDFVAGDFDQVYLCANDMNWFTDALSRKTKKLLSPELIAELEKAGEL